MTTSAHMHAYMHIKMLVEILSPQVEIITALSSFNALFGIHPSFLLNTRSTLQKLLSFPDKHCKLLIGCDSHPA